MRTRFRKPLLYPLSYGGAKALRVAPVAGGLCPASLVRLAPAGIESRGVAQRAIIACFLAAALATVGAGCGGDDSGGSGTASFDAQSYAANVCNLALSWGSADTAIDAAVSGSGTEADAANDVSQAQAETNVYIHDLQGLEQPDGSAEQTAYASLQETADALREHSSSIHAEGNKLAQGDQTMAQAGAAVKAQIELINQDLRASVQQLDQVYPDSGISGLVADDQTCRALG